MALPADKTEIKQREAMEEPTDAQQQIAESPYVPQLEQGVETPEYIEDPHEEGVTSGLSLEPSVRRRNPTDRGLQYQLDVRRKNLRTALNKWRKCTDRTADLIIDVEDVHVLYRQRDELTQLLDEVESSSNAIWDISPAEDIRIDMIQQEYRELRKALNTRIKELRGYDASSKISRKTKSASHTSMKSTRSLKTEEEAKAAAIQVQLKYHQAETEMVKLKIEKDRAIEANAAKEKAEIEANAAKEKAEIEAAATRMQLQKELDIAKARLQVFKEEEEMSQELGSDGSSDKEDSQVRVRRFLESLPVQPEMLQNAATTTAAVATTYLASSGFNLS